MTPRTGQVISLASLLSSRHLRGHLIPGRHIDFLAHVRHIPLRRGADFVRAVWLVELKCRGK